MSYSIGQQFGHYSLDTITGKNYLNFARPNRFFLECVFPPQLVSQIDVERLDILCESVVLPGHRLGTGSEMSTYKSRVIPYTFLYDDLSITFKLSEDHSEKVYFEQWMDIIMNTQTYELSYYNDVTASNWAIYQLDRENKVTAGTQFFGIFPITIQTLQYDNTNADPLKIQIDLAFQYKEDINGPYQPIIIDPYQTDPYQTDLFMV